MLQTLLDLFCFFYLWRKSPLITIIGYFKQNFSFSLLGALLYYILIETDIKGESND